jgi:diacylglycerol kinase (ATP)
MRWGLEDGGHSEPMSVRDIFEEACAEDLEDDDQFLQALIKERNRERWHHKSSRSGSVIESFYHAFHGLKVGFSSQRNIRIHCCIASGVFLLALLLHVDATSWLALGLATGFVLFAEYINTAVEHVTDIQANFRYHRSARYAKDTAAAAVLIAALTAVLVGAIVFVPRIFALLNGQF